MLDIKFIREHKDIIAAGAKKKRIEVDLDALIALDDRRKALQASVDEKRAAQNSASEKIAGAGAEKAVLIADMQKIKEAMKKDEEELRQVMEEWRNLMVRVPNVPDMSVPEGESDADNQEVRTWGDLPKFNFDPKPHSELMLMNDMADFDRGTKVAGFRGYFLKNDGARLVWALERFVIDHFSKKDFVPMIVPSMVRKEPFMGTGYLPQSEEDLYKTQDGDYLAGTA